MIKLLNTQKGASLAIVLIVIMVMSVLGATFISIGLAETRQVAMQEKQMQAYYLARSGAETIAEDILHNTDDTLRNYLESNLGQTVRSVNNALGEGTFNLDVKKDSSDILIEATGIVPGPYGNVTAKATLRLIDLYNNAITAVNSFNLSGLSTLRGDVESTLGTVTGSPTHSWLEPNEISEGTSRDLPPVEVPVLTPYDDGATATSAPHPLNVPNNTSVILPGSFEYSSITVNNGGVLEVNTSAGDVEIVAGFMDVKGGIRIVGSNRVFIFLTSTTKSEFKTSDDSTNTSDQLFILLASGSSIEIKTGNRDFYGLVYGPEATVTLGSNAVVRGSVTGNIFTASGNPSLYHEPLTVTPAVLSSYISGFTRYGKGNWE